MEFCKINSSIDYKKWIFRQPVSEKILNFVKQSVKNSRISSNYSENTIENFVKQARKKKNANFVLTITKIFFPIFAKWSRKIIIVNISSNDHGKSRVSSNDYKSRNERKSRLSSNGRERKSIFFVNNLDKILIFVKWSYKKNSYFRPRILLKNILLNIIAKQFLKVFFKSYLIKSFIFLRFE